MKKSIEISLSQILSNNAPPTVERRTVLRLSLFGLAAIVAPISLGFIARKCQEFVIVDGWIIASEDLNRCPSALRRS